MKPLILCLTLLSAPAWADNCYICGSGSSDYCKNYCKYPGTDTQQTRKQCSDAGCKISGTASCPTAVNYKVCTVGSVTHSKGVIRRYAKNLKQDPSASPQDDKGI